MRRALCALATLGLVVWANAAGATNVTEFPDNGSEQMARGGAWIARASDPLAAFYNPAGLAGQHTRVSLQANLVFGQTCFRRFKDPLDTTQEQGVGADGYFPKVCSDGAPQLPPTLQLAFTWRVMPRLGIGFAFITPSGVAKADWPDTIEVNGTRAPAPQRYMLIKGDALVVTPTVGVGYEPIDGLRLGAAFQWGIASLNFTSAAASINTDRAQPRDNDIKAELAAKDMFVPGGTFGALWSPSDWLDIAGWLKVSKSIEAKGDLKTHVNAFQPNVLNGTRQPVEGNSALPNCGVPGPAPSGQPDPCGPNQARVGVPIPMELKVGVRVHKPISRQQGTHIRDPLSQDKWDLEVNFTFAKNSDFQALTVRLPPYDAAPGYDGVLPVNGLPGSPLPTNADVPHRYKDVFGVRVGGDYNIIPDVLAARAGVFVESRAQDQRYQNIDFIGAARFGFSLGGTYRLRFSKDPKKTSALELSVGYMHMFAFDQSFTGPGGLSALEGTPCNPAGGAGADPTTCPNGTTRYRSNWAVNLGDISSALNAFNIGASYRF
jgi:long-chain fatty acid transport protein